MAKTKLTPAKAQEGPVERYIVVPFKKVGKGLAVGEIRPSSTAAGARRLAEAMSARLLGVAAYAVTADQETGEMINPRLLCAFGETADIAAQ